MLIKADRVVGHRMSIGIWCGVVGQSEADHIFVGACAQLAETIGFHLTSIGDQNDLGTFEHKNTRTFGELAIITDHGADLE